jgi:hypothetical protein
VQLEPGLTRKQLLAAIGEHILVQARLVGLYENQGKRKTDIASVSWEKICQNQNNIGVSRLFRSFAIPIVALTRTSKL